MNYFRSGGRRQEIPRDMRFRLPVGFHRGHFPSWFIGLLRSRLANTSNHHQCTNVRPRRPLLVKKGHDAIFFFKNPFFSHAKFNCTRIVPESIRWLIIKKRFSEAHLLILKCAKMNKKSVPNHLIAIPDDKKEDVIIIFKRLAINVISYF